MCDTLRDLVPFTQSKKLEKHLQKSATCSKVAGFSHLTISLVLFTHSFIDASEYAQVRLNYTLN